MEEKVLSLTGLGQKTYRPRLGATGGNGQAHLETPSWGKEKKEEKAQDVLPGSLGVGRTAAVPAGSGGHQGHLGQGYLGYEAVGSPEEKETTAVPVDILGGQNQVQVVGLQS